MGRRQHRVPFVLDPGDIKRLGDEEIRLILRGADGLIMQGGRSLLAKVLKGSKEKKLLELELNQSPAYGGLSHLTVEAITARIDWLILQGYLDIEYDGRLPLLVYTPKGWDIERETYVQELHAELDAQLVASETVPDLSDLNDRNREMVMEFIERIEATGDSKYLPALKVWSANTYKKIRVRLQNAIDQLQT